MTAVNRVDVFENIYVKDSSDVDVSSLAQLLGVHQKDLATAFRISPATAGRKGIDSNNQVMKQWMRVFNLVVDLIEASEPTLQKDAIQVKMGRWLRLPNSHFNGKSPLDMMMHGQARKVIKLLEQLSA